MKRLVVVLFVFFLVGPYALQYAPGSADGIRQRHDTTQSKDETDLVAWDVDHVLLRGGDRLKALWEFPNKLALVWSSLQPPLIWGALNIFVRHIWNIEASGDYWIKLADDHNRPELRRCFIGVLNTKELNHDVIAIARHLKEEHKYRQVLASNMPQECFDDLLKNPKFSFFEELFDLKGSQFLSCEIVQKGVYKPRPDFYKALLALNGLSNYPQKVVFVDNKHANAKTAEDLGIRVIHASYKDPSKIGEELSKFLGVDIPVEVYAKGRSRSLS